jgi:hypothetical protein
MTMLTLLLVLAIATPFVLFMLVLAWADFYSRGARTATNLTADADQPAETDCRDAA